MLIYNNLLYNCTFLILYSFYAQTAAADTARVEKQTFVCTNKKSDAVPDTAEGVVSTLGNWMEPSKMDKELDEKFDGCMEGEIIATLLYVQIYQVTVVE